VAVAEAGLFLEIAREARSLYGEEVKLRFLCGRDAAERIVSWDYGDLPPIHRQLEEFELLVAPRQGRYHPPPHLENAIAPLHIAEEWEEVASSLVRKRLMEGGDCEHWIPPAIAGRVCQIYRRRAKMLATEEQ